MDNRQIYLPYSFNPVINKTLSNLMFPFKNDQPLKNCLQISHYVILSPNLKFNLLSACFLLIRTAFVFGTDYMCNK